jgi:hypothetical protein
MRLRLLPALLGLALLAAAAPVTVFMIGDSTMDLPLSKHVVGVTK